MGRGAALGIIRLRPSAGGEEKLRAALRDQLDPAKLDGIISMHLIESDPALSKPLTDDPAAPNPGAGDWFVLIDATDVNAVPAAAARFNDNAVFKSLVDLERRLPADVGYRQERPSARLNIHAIRVCGGAVHAAPPHNLSSTLTLRCAPCIESWRSRKIAFVQRLEWL